jgi:hypothetical protein
MRKLVFLACVAGLCLADPVSAKMINFDDLTIPNNTLYPRIPNPYAGFDWSAHFLYLDAGNYLFPSGYQNFVGPNLGLNVAFNGGGSKGAPPPPVNFSRRTPFELDSFYLAAAWRDGLQVAVTGELCSPPASPQTCVVVDSTTLTVNESGPTLETLNWNDVNKVVFQSVPGSGVPVGFTQGYSFVLDNISVGPVRGSSIRLNALAAVPETSTWTLMLIGFAGLGFAAYNRPTSGRSPRDIRVRSGLA